VLRKAHDVVDPKGLRGLGGSVHAPVVDDEHFDCVHALDGTRKVRYCLSELVAFVEARDLNDEFHGGVHSAEARKGRNYPRSALLQMYLDWFAAREETDQP
jgi:hypothetical protein